MTITMHMCRGNFRSTFIAKGGYEPVAEAMFNQINVHGYFMEYDLDRAGGLSCCASCRSGKTVVLGLVTSKTGTLESKDEIKANDEAAKYVLLDCWSVAAVRLCFERGGQRVGRGRAMGEASHDREIADEVWGRS